ncbi:DUF3253 domain-containing protein [Actinomarinicola tropica]|uniref:DUF3253 domain-containing protein n=1 Tax=Actinomarinicola tropica TaxID=2789776 RepID=A0A5Q2RGV6_9ACTN|nr:DUF3253 domain-containing protein [Actinomarinicola tropica]QGG93761.1 DUF3253 domain-containing protein [Actinomarinicola tropica]
MAADDTPVETTADGRWVVVDGRRWRASDPSIPEALRTELVGELMDARRAVGAARRAGDEGAERNARDRVHAANVALGERGHPWWDEPTATSRDERIAATIEALASRRGERTFCPSDVARVVGGDSWRRSMDDVRVVLRHMAGSGDVEVLQRGRRLGHDDEWRGPIRVRRALAD